MPATEATMDKKYIKEIKLPCFSSEYVFDTMVHMLLKNVFRLMLSSSVFLL